MWINKQGLQAGRRTGMSATWVSLNSHHLRQVTSSVTWP